MSDEHPFGGSSPAPAEGDPLAACTAVLMTVPYEVAHRFEMFLRANEVACRIRPSDVSADDVAKRALGSGADVVPGGPIGRLIKGRLGRDLNAEITVRTSGAVKAYDVLVRPQDLPPALAGSPAGEPTAGTSQDDPWGRPATVSAVAGTSVDAGAQRSDSVAGAVAVCELPWEAAWKLVADLAAAGIPAAVMEPEAPAGGTPMERRIVPVGVRPDDLERARGMVES